MFKVPSRICLGLELNLTETLFFFRLSFTLSASNIHNPNSTPRLPAPPYLRTRTSRETQSLVSLDARRFSRKVVQLFSPKRVNLLICWLSIALRWAHPRAPSDPARGYNDNADRWLCVSLSNKTQFSMHLEVRKF